MDRDTISFNRNDVGINPPQRHGKQWCVIRKKYILPERVIHLGEMPRPKSARFLCNKLGKCEIIF